MSVPAREAARTVSKALAKSKWRASRVACRRSQSRVMVSCASATSGPVTRTAKSKRGSSSLPWFGSR